jgi:hypothetical protein
MPYITYNGVIISTIVKEDKTFLFRTDKIMKAIGCTTQLDLSTHIETIEEEGEQIQYITFDGLFQAISLTSKASICSVLYHLYSHIIPLLFPTDDDLCDYLLEFQLGRRQAKLPIIEEPVVEEPVVEEPVEGGE